MSLFTVNGDKIKSFKDISPDLKVVVMSLDGTFRGLQNALRPSEVQKQRIIQEKNTRNAFSQVKNNFSQKVKAARDKDLAEGSKNLIHRKKIMSKLKYSRGFRPPFTGGLFKSPAEVKDLKSKTLTFKLLYNRIMKNKSIEKPLKTAQDLFKDYAEKRSIKETTIEMMNDLEKKINSQIDVYVENMKPNAL